MMHTSEAVQQMHAQSLSDKALVMKQALDL